MTASARASGPGPGPGPGPGLVARLAVGLAVAVVVATGIAAPARADQYLPVEPNDADAGPPVRVRALVTDGMSASSLPSFGYVLVEVENRDGAEHSLGLVLKSIGNEARPAPFRASRTLACPPGETRRTTLPLGSAGIASGYEVLEVTVDGSDWGSATIQRRYPGSRPAGAALLAVGVDAEASLVLRRAVEDLAGLNTAATRRAFGVEVHVREPRELPDRWSELTAFPLVVVDGASGDLTADRQQVLADYLGGGGRILVVRADRLPPGPLARAVSEPDPFGPPGRARPDGGRAGAHGFGSWLAIPRGPEAIGSQDLGLLLEGGAPISPWTWRFPDPLASAWPIPEIGRVPVRLFVGLILVYVVLAGPGSFLWFRRRRPAGWLVTAPLLGLGLTAGILGYGLFGEGFGVRSTVASVTLLDQRRHEAHAVATRTLYAGISPRGGLRPEAGTCLVPLPQERPDDEHGYGPRRDRAARVAGSYEVDLDAGGRLRAGAVPSRTVSSFLTVSRARVRARLAFRRLPDGGLERLADPELQPLDEPGSLVVRDHAGKLFILERAGKLVEARPTPEDVARVGRLLRALPQAFAQARADGAGGDGPRNRRRGRDEPPPGPLGEDAPFVLWIARRLRGDSLAGPIPPGTYIARVRRSPAVDALGLEADERLGCHIVIGALAEEDIVEPR